MIVGSTNKESASLAATVLMEVIPDDLDKVSREFDTGLERYMRSQNNYLSVSIRKEDSDTAVKVSPPLNLWGLKGGMQSKVPSATMDSNTIIIEAPAISKILSVCFGGQNRVQFYASGTGEMAPHQDGNSGESQGMKQKFSLLFATRDHP